MTPLVSGEVAGTSVEDGTTLDGTVYYFSSTGNDSNNGLSESTPKRNLSQVLGLNLDPGDAIKLKSGDRFEVPFNGSSFIGLLWDGIESGTKENPITITSYGSGSKPVIDFNNNRRGISIRSTHDWTFDNLRLEGASRTQLEVYTTNQSMYGIRLFRLEIDGEDAQGGNPNIVFHHNQKAVLGVEGDYTRHVDTIEVAKCVIRNAGDSQGNSDGLRLWSVRSNAHVWGNEFYNNGGDAIDVAGGKDHVVEYNYMDGGFNDRSTGGKSHGQYYQIDNFTLRFNVIKNMKNKGWSLEDADDCWVYHNTMDMPNNGFGVFALYGKNRPSEIDGNNILNNIFRGGLSDHGPITVYVNGQATDAGGRFTGPVIDYMGVLWETDGKVDTMNYNLIAPYEISEVCVVRYVYQNANLSYASQFPERGGSDVSTCVPLADMDTRWTDFVFHNRDRVGTPDWNSSTIDGYQLTTSSDGLGMSKNLYELLPNERFRDFQQRPVIYDNESSNPGANVYTSN